MIRVRLRIGIRVSASVIRVRVRKGMENSPSCMFVHPGQKITPSGKEMSAVDLDSNCQNSNGCHSSCGLTRLIHNSVSNGRYKSDMDMGCCLSTNSIRPMPVLKIRYNNNNIKSK